MKESFAIFSQTNSGKCVIKFKFSSSVEGAPCSTTLKASHRETSPSKKLLSASQGELGFIVVFLLRCETFHLRLVRIYKAVWCPNLRGNQRDYTEIKHRSQSKVCIQCCYKSRQLSCIIHRNTGALKLFARIYFIFVSLLTI